MTRRKSAGSNLAQFLDAEVVEHTSEFDADFIGQACDGTLLHQRYRVVGSAGGVSPTRSCGS